jgi:hypothetical protein
MARNLLCSATGIEKMGILRLMKIRPLHSQGRNGTPLPGSLRHGDNTPVIEDRKERIPFPLPLTRAIQNSSPIRHQNLLVLAWFSGYTEPEEQDGQRVLGC